MNIFVSCGEVLKPFPESEVCGMSGHKGASAGDTAKGGYNEP